MYGQLTNDQQAELDALRKRRRLLNPAQIVEFASDPKTALHSRFTWDDTAAAREYRLWQARTILRVSVYVPEGSTEPVRAFVSLHDDRTAKGGYRSVSDVLKDKGLRATMLAEALAELQVFQRKYRLLKELQPVFAAAARVQKQQTKAKDNGEPRRRKRAAALV